MTLRSVSTACWKSVTPRPPEVSQEDAQLISTSALAKRLKLPIQQLFVTLRDYGWIERDGENWQVTAKGQLHGGGYKDSQRFGRYIVWPDSISEHPLVASIESDQRLTSGALADQFPACDALTINRVLQELGFVHQRAGGLQLTSRGEALGGREELDERSGLRVVTWPRDFAQHPVLRREFLGQEDDAGDTEPAMTSMEAASGPVSDDEATPDLFAAESQNEDQREVESVSRTRRSTSGHVVDTHLQLVVCNWLYRAGLVHAFQRALPVEEEIYADFYVPAASLVIECWEQDVPTLTLARRLRVREVCREIDMPYLELTNADESRLEQVLGSKLRELGALS